MRNKIADYNLRRLWITSFRTEETRSSSGTDQTGRHCVRSATIRRPEERIATRFTIIKRSIVELFIQISLGIQNAAYLHGVIDDNIEYRKFSDVDSVIRMRSFL